MESNNVSVIWSIKNFSFCPQKFDEYVQSPYFLTFARDSGTELGCLRLYPRGTIQNEDSISCLLCLRGYDGSVIQQQIPCVCSIKILTTHGTTLLEIKNSYINNGISRFGLFVKRNDIFKQNFILPDDTLRIRLIFNHSLGEYRENTELSVKSLRHNYSFHTVIDVEKYSFTLNLKENILNRKEITLSEKRKFAMTGIIKDTVLKLNTEAINFKRFVGVVKCNLSLLRKKEREKMLNESEIFFDGTHNDLSNSRELTFSVPKETFEAPQLEMEDGLQLARLRCELAFSQVEYEEEEQNISSCETSDNPDLFRDFLCMYSSKKMTDVSLRVDEQTFRAHKFVLSARSPVFSKMFEKDMLENQSGVVDIKDIDDDTLKNFLLYLYGGTLQKLNKNSAWKLILVADRYLVTSLKRICSSFLVSNITEETVCESLILADMINDENLKESAINCFLSHTKVILESLEWKQFQDDHPKLANEALRKFAVEACSKPSI